MEAQLGALFTIPLLLLILIHCGEAQRVTSGSANERAALLDLRSSLGLRGKDWPIKTDMCRWTGVECDRNGRVVGLTISGLRRTRAGRKQPQFAVDSLANLTRLTRFNASGFYLPGSIPDWFGQRLVSLKLLDLRSASILGPIPSSISGLTRLRCLYLSGNDLSGGVPSSLGQLPELSVLDLSRNSLTGSIPSEFSSLGNLKILDLSSNFLSGQIPPGLGNLSKLQNLSLSDNSLTVSIPVQLSELSQLVGLNLSKNFLSGSLPLELKRLRNLTSIDVGINSLEGPLPEGLFSSFSQLQIVVLSGNKLDGSLPGIFWSIPNLRFLDVSSNNFTGDLPSLASNVSFSNTVFNLSNNLLYGNLSSLGKFRFIDLSGNYFQGVVSESGGNVSVAKNCLQSQRNQRKLEDCSLFYTQRGLTFDNFGDQDSGSKNRLTFILVGVFGGVGFIVILALVLVLFLKWKNKGVANQRGGSNSGPVQEVNPSLPKEPIYLTGLGELFTYEQIVLFTHDFSEANLIKHGHSGDLFQGFLEGGIPVVIKRVDLGSQKSDSYMMELDFFRKVSHTRLVPLLGHCLEHETKKFLVYKYMPNGDLANSLHRVVSSGKDGLQSLDWITRLKIAIGAAEFLAHLHHECSPPLVHRDVQASSILLDDKFEVRLGSLSEAQAQEGDANQNVITRFLRKPQSSEQGLFAPPLATCAHDVYCFGKVLLELVTGKLDISKVDDATTREWLEHTLRYVSIYDKELINKIVDPSLIVDEDLLEEVWAMAIVARTCLNPKPSKRPHMKHILRALENPLKVVRVESSSSARLRTTSSRLSWSMAFLGSWRHSSSENIRENISSLKQSGRVGSQSSTGGNNEHSSSNKRSSSEIFPEPVEGQDLERQSEH
ncbi:putative LRR receptor-like serine/threonine-protein kinase [Morus notabilis]|uniref:Putative LRR receptor-like serine/threonine-protein kinase n=1 Tax=Morus notabilis TaxID=981085 RepID=W9REW3_9ROSA|nr:probable LRR receptor-like serine/threonine-protein kinase At2g16250 [Morus notabilis]EXB67768.1 putative LRR receptor-like serine/threonine-protein kinase [Morus notabilis]